MRLWNAGPALLLWLGAGGTAWAQGDCTPGDGSNEAKTLAIFSVPLAFSPVAAPGTGRPGFRFSLEASSLPNVDPATATPTICRPGKGPEHTDLLPGILRPRAALVLPGGFAFELSWVPPLRVSGVKANLIGVAFGWSRSLGGPWALGLRTHTTLGQVNGPVTCPEEALADPASECFGGTESDDRYRPNILGADVTLGYTAAGPWRPYLGAGYNHLRPRFQVHFVNSAGSLDDRRVIVNLDRVALFGGIGWMPGGAWGLTGEVYATPGDAVTGRLAVMVR